MSARAAAAPAAALRTSVRRAQHTRQVDHRDRSVDLERLGDRRGTRWANPAPASPVPRTAAAAASAHRERRPPPRPSARRAQRTPQVNRERLIQVLGSHVP